MGWFGLVLWLLFRDGFGCEFSEVSGFFDFFGVFDFLGFWVLWFYGSGYVGNSGFVFCYGVGIIRKLLDFGCLV